MVNFLKKLERNEILRKSIKRKDGRCHKFLRIMEINFYVFMAHNLVFNRENCKAYDEKNLNSKFIELNISE